MVICADAHGCLRVHEQPFARTQTVFATSFFLIGGHSGAMTGYAELLGRAKRKKFRILRFGKKRNEFLCFALDFS